MTADATSDSLQFMRLTDRVISLHPAVVTTTFLALFMGSGIAINIQTFGASFFYFVFSGSMLVMIAALMLWHYSLYRAATDRNSDVVGHGGRRGFLFVTASIGTCAFLILLSAQWFIAPESPIQATVATAMPIAMLVGNVSYFASIWAAANALTRFDERQRSVEIHKTLGTFFLEFYLPFGIWVIYPRIKRLLAAPLTIGT